MKDSGRIEEGLGGAIFRLSPLNHRNQFTMVPGAFLAYRRLEMRFNLLKDTWKD